MNIRQEQPSDYREVENLTREAFWNIYRPGCTEHFVLNRFRENPDFDPEHFFDDVIGVSKNIGGKPRTIKFWASREQSKYIKTKPIHRSQQLMKENPEDGSCVFRIDVVFNIEMYSVFMSYGPGVRILYPQSAVKYMRDKLREALDQYGEGQEGQDGQ